MGLADSAETLGVDLRTSTKKLVAKEQTLRRNCDAREELRFSEETCEDIASQDSLLEGDGARNVMRKLVVEGGWVDGKDALQVGSMWLVSGAT